MSTQLRLALLVTAAFGAGWTLSSCGSSGGNGNGNSDGSTPSNNLFACAGASCGSSELQTYQTCVTGKCGDAFKSCYGPGSLQGNFNGGQCGDYRTCVQKCGCSDYQCFVACGVRPVACQLCEATVSACEESSGCTKPACLGAIPDGGVSFPDGSFILPDADIGAFLDALSAPATCNDLLNCCNMLATPSKELCLMQYNDLKPMGDQQCAYGYNGLKIAQICK
jgi:hypothetical protein